MKIQFKNPLEVNENDTIGTAVLKGATVGYIKGVLAAGAGLGVLALGVFALSKKEEDSKKKQEEKEIFEEASKIKETSAKAIDDANKIINGDFSSIEGS